MKIRHLGLKQRRFGMLKKKEIYIYIVLVSVIEKSPRASLSSLTAEKMEKKKKKEKKKKAKEKKLENALGEVLPPGVVAPGL